MTTIVSAVDARKNLGHLLNLVSLTHEQVIIERAGKKMAVLTEYNDKPETSAPKRKLDIRDIRGLGKEIWHTVDVDEYIRNERDSWE